MNPFDCLLILKKKNTVQHLKETLKASRWIEEASESRFIPYWAVKSAFCPQDDKKKCCFQHLWTFCLIYRVFFKTCTRQKQRQGSWKLDLNTKKKKKVSKAICDALCPRIPKGRDRIQDRLLENPVSVDRFSTKKWKHTDFYT